MDINFKEVIYMCEKHKDIISKYRKDCTDVVLKLAYFDAADKNPATFAEADKNLAKKLDSFADDAELTRRGLYRLLYYVLLICVSARRRFNESVRGMRGFFRRRLVDTTLSQDYSQTLNILSEYASWKSLENYKDEVKKQAKNSKDSWWQYVHPSLIKLKETVLRRTTKKQEPENDRHLPEKIDKKKLDEIRQAICDLLWCVPSWRKVDDEDKRQMTPCFNRLREVLGLEKAENPMALAELDEVDGIVKEIGKGFPENDLGLGFDIKRYRKIRWEDYSETEW